METYNIQTIVRALNQPPHNLNLTLVEFDEKSCIKLLQILLDVLSSIESNAQLHAQQREGDHGNKDEFQNSVVVEQYGIGIGIGKGRERERENRWNVRSYYNNFKAVEVELLPLLDLFGYHPHHGNSTSTRSLSQSRHHLDHVNDQENQFQVPVNDAGSTVSMTMFMPDPDSTPDSFHKLINLPPEELEIFIDKIAMGDKDTIYPILEYCLSNQDKLKERLYLAPFLTPVQVPLDITMTQRGDDLSNLSRGYQNLQDEFKVLYDEYRRLKEEMMNDDEHSNQKGDQGLRTLQEEKVQLMERIGRMEDMASNNHDLYRLFELTRELRKCQEDDVRLRQYKCPEQKNALEAARGKLKHLQSRYDAIRALISNDDEEGTGGRSGSQPLSSSQSSLSSSSPAADNILNEIRKEVSSMTMSVRSDLLSQKADIETKIAKLEEANSMPLRTKDELEGLIKTRTELEEEYDTKGSLLSEEQKKASNSKIVIFKKHAKVSASKLKVKRMDVKKKQEQLDEMKKRVKQAEMNLESYVQSTKQREEIHAETCRNIEIDLPDGTRIIGGVDGKRFLDSCHEKCKQRDEVQKKISKLQSETQVLEGTLNALYRRHGNIEEFLKKQEENAGVKGFRETHEKILDTEKRAEEVNRIKGETLQEVSDMVTEMTSRLKRDRKKLQPMINDLKKSRAEFQSLKETHDERKAQYDKLASKLSSERQHLDRDCDRDHTEWLQVERNYHYFLSIAEITKINLEKVNSEEKWQRGEEKMLPDFQCLHDLYEHKLNQQESLSKQLRIEQRMIKESESENIKQRKMFLQLRGLLQLKEKITTRDSIERDIPQDDSLLSDQISVGNLTQILSF